jgi:hypothetical protein
MQYTDSDYTSAGCTMTKPPKPSPDFPLFSHASGKWGKKVNGTVRYFGSWKHTSDEDPDGSVGALREYQSWVESRATLAPASVTVEYALNRFLAAKKSASESGLISSRTYLEHQRTCSRFANFVGKRRDVTHARRLPAVSGFSGEDFESGVSR